MRYSGILAAVFLTVSSVAWADTGAPGKQPPGGAGPSPEQRQQHFQEMKQKHLEMMDKEIQLIQESRSCVQAANDHDAIRACHEAARAKREQLKESFRQMNGGRDGTPHPAGK